MLTESSYLFAIYVYVGAAGLALLYLGWMCRRFPVALVSLIVLLGAALLLTPAFPREGVDTMAPALVVAGFQLFTEGFEAAVHAIRPLAYASGLALIVSICLWLVVLLRRRRE